MTDELLEEASLKDMVHKDLLRLAKKNSLNSLEKPKQLKLLKDPFSQENNLITPTMKLKRNVAKVYFKDAIEHLYSLPPMNTKQ